MLDKILKEHPYLAEIAKSIYLLNKDEYDELAKTKTYSFMVEGKKEPTPVGEGFLRKVLSDEYCFNTVINNLSINGRYSFAHIQNGDYMRNISIPISAIMGYFSQVSDMNEEEKVRYDKLLQLTSTKNLTESEEVFTSQIDGKSKKIKISEIMKILHLEEKEIQEMYSKKEAIPGFTPEELSYVINDFATSKYIKNRYRLNIFESTRLRSLTSLNKVDYEAINKLYETHDESYGKVKLHGELVREIKKNMPPEYDEMHKAIYIYLKMCSLLSYDSEFYAMEQKGEVAARHKDIQRVAKITPKNNLVVCYEFNAIYAKLLDEMGIHYHSGGTMTDEYGAGHMNLSFRVGKYLVEADSVTSILEGDMVNVKLPAKVNGLACSNSNGKTREEFQSALKEVYEIVFDEEEEKKENKELFSMDDLVKLYQQAKRNEWMKVDLREKVDELFDQVVKSGLTGVDALGYIIHLKKKLFTENERKYNIAFNIMKYYRIPEEEGPNELLGPAVIITLNNTSVTAGADNTYIHFEPPSTFVPIQTDELREKISSGEYSYFSTAKNPIPGLNMGGSYVR